MNKDTALFCDICGNELNAALYCPACDQPIYARKQEREEKAEEKKND